MAWSDVKALGDFIVAQLDDGRREPELVAHWIAHRLAEHLTEAETGRTRAVRERARAAAEDLVPRLWAARQGWPYGWPVLAVRRLVDELRDRVGEDEELPTTPWLSTLRELQRLHRNEIQVWLWAALLEFDERSLRAAIAAAPEDDLASLDREDADEDLKLTRWQLDQHERAEKWIANLAEPGERPSRRRDRARMLARALAELASERSDLVERALAEAERGPSRRRGRGGRGKKGTTASTAKRTSRRKQQGAATKRTAKPKPTLASKPAAKKKPAAAKKTPATAKKTPATAKKTRPTAKKSRGGGRQAAR